MRINRETVVTMKPNKEEKTAISIVDVILRDIQDVFPPGCSFENMETGEIFNIKEIAKVRSILGTFIDTNGNFRMK
jgi:pyoverdine/dityrosine biosynthesis protein Dit1